jgi:hypothetical protein
VLEGKMGRKSLIQATEIKCRYCGEAHFSKNEEKRCKKQRNRAGKKGKKSTKKRKK